MIQIVAGGTVETELGQLGLVILRAQQLYREAPADMGGIEQRAIGTVINVQFGAAAALYLDDDGIIFRAQGTARLTPEFGRIADRQIPIGAVDGIEILLQRRWLQPRID